MNNKSTINGFLWSAFQQFGAQIIGFIVTILMTRHFEPSEFGLIAMMTFFYGIGYTILQVGMSSSIIRTTNPDSLDYDTVFVSNLLISLFIYVVFFFFAPLMSSFFNQDSLTSIIRIYSLTLIIDAFSSIYITKLTKEIQFKNQATIQLATSICSSFLGVFLVFNNFGIWSYIYMVLCQSFLLSLSFWFFMSWRPHFRFCASKFKIHFIFGYKLILVGLMDNLLNNLYTFILAKFFPIKQLGLYSRADSLKQIPVLNITQILTKVTLPLFSKHQNDNVELIKYYKNILLIVLFFNAALLVYVSVTAESLFLLVFTDKWLPAVPYFQLLCLAGIFQPINAYNMNVLTAMGNSLLYLKIDLWKKVISVILIGLSLYYGIYGLIISQIILSILFFFINSYFIGKVIKYDLKLQLINVFPILILSFAFFISLFCINYFLQNNNLNAISIITINFIFGVLFYISNVFIFKLKILNTIMRMYRVIRLK
nr:lipopolysaccharide biosynthesis protein [uncultured Flavobacterium sp.]